MVRLRTEKGKIVDPESELGGTSDTEGKISGSESEVGGTSDTEMGNQRFRVRTRINFGHKKGKWAA
ncbi:hypothetical protein C1N70_23995 [Cytobacillus firmus]